MVTDLVQVKQCPFSILGTRVGDVWQVYETFSILFSGTKIFRAIFMGYKTILLERILDEVIDQRLKENS